MFSLIKTHHFGPKRKKQTEEESGQSLANSESISVRTSPIQNAVHMVWKASDVDCAYSALNLQTFQNIKALK